jgi:hypothetical protein
MRSWRELIPPDVVSARTTGKSGRQRLIQREPLFRNPRAHQADRRDHGNQLRPSGIGGKPSQLWASELLMGFGFNGVDAMTVEGPRGYPRAIIR